MALDSWLQDVRYGVRRMRRSPGFTLTAAIVLSLGIGVNTALFSVVNALFFRDLHIQASSQLFYLYSESLSSRQLYPLLYGRNNLDELRNDELAVFSGRITTGQSVTVGDDTQIGYGEYVESNYFDLLGVPAARGRLLRPEDNLPGITEPSLVVSDDFFERRLKGDPARLGELVRIGRVFYRVVGVTPPGFRGLNGAFQPAQYWVPSAHAESGVRRGTSTYLIGRLKPGVTVQQYEAFVRAGTPRARQRTMDGLRPESRERFLDWGKSAQFYLRRAIDVDLPEAPNRPLVSSRILGALTAVVLLVLTIATTNIAGMLLARGVTRTSEVAVRRALGASGGRLVRQLFTESVLLAVAGGGVGALAASLLLGVFRAVTPPAYVVDVTFDWRVLTFAAVLCLGAGLVVGIAPAIQAARINVLEALGAGIVGARRIRARLRHWVVVPQVALSLVLLVVAATHVRSLTAVELVDPGYRLDDTVVMNVSRWEWTPPYGYGGADGPRLQEEAAAKVRAFNRSVVSRLANVASVSTFALASQLPLSRGGVGTPVVTDVAARTSGASATEMLVTDRYFDVMGIRIQQGRSFDDRDTLYGMPVALVSEALQRTLWPAGDAIGKRLAFVPAQANQKIKWLEVIGVVNDVDPVLSDTDAPPMVYMSVMQQWRGYASSLIIRGNGDQPSLIRDAKAAVLGADTYAEVTRVRTVRQIAGEILYPRRVAAAILSTAGFIGLALACIGLYGVISYSVAQRRREIGIRATLGAERRDIIRLVLREGAAVTVLGTAIGGVLTYFALRMSANVIAGVPLLDLASFVSVPIVLMTIVIAACVIPARRAANTDPASVLRSI